MNQEANLTQMQSLRLSGMAEAYEAFLALPAQEQSHLPTALLLSRLLESESAYQKQNKVRSLIGKARFRYSASVEEIDFLPARHLERQTLLTLMEMRSFQPGK
jgi:IstB-like ATP binding protein